MTARQAKLKSLEVVQRWVLGKVVDWLNYRVTQQSQEILDDYGLTRSIAYFGHALIGSGYIRQPMARGDRVQCEGKTFTVTDLRVVITNWDRNEVIAEIHGTSS